MLWIIGIAVGVAERGDFLFLASGSVYFEDFIESFIAHPEIAGAIPDRPLGKAEARRQLGQLRFSIEESPKLRWKSLKFEPHIFRFSMTQARGRAGNQQQGRSGYRNLEDDDGKP